MLRPRVAVGKGEIVPMESPFPSACVGERDGVRGALIAVLLWSIPSEPQSSPSHAPALVGSVESVGRQGRTVRRTVAPQSPARSGDRPDLAEYGRVTQAQL